MTSLCYIVCGIALFLTVVTVVGANPVASSEITESARVPQQIPDGCFEGVHDCPPFFGHEDWGNRTHTICCPGQADLVFHCQERKDTATNTNTLTKACLPVLQCPPGTVPAVLYEATDDKTRYAYIRCTPCPHEDTFEPFPRKSHEYSHPVCSHRHKICHLHDGTVLAKGGNSTHDATCRCDWQAGFAPLHHSPECLSPNGFGSHSPCLCRQHVCGDGESLNEDYRCIKTPSTSKRKVTAEEGNDRNNKSENSVVRVFGPVGIPFPEGKKGGGDLWYIPVIALVLLVGGPALFTLYRKIGRRLLLRS